MTCWNFVADPASEDSLQSRRGTYGCFKLVTEIVCRGYMRCDDRDVTTGVS